MKLSVITINYNNREGLQRTIDSVLAQTWKDYEWIIVDGGSTDGSKELIEKYAAQGCFAWWCSEKDKGVYNAMNKGIAHAKGEYLNFMNSGDAFYDCNVLEYVFQKNNYEADILYGDVEKVYKDRKEVIPAIHPLTLRLLCKSNFCHQSSFIRTELLKLEGYNESLKIVSDWEKWIVWALQNKEFEYIPIVISSIDTNGISLTNIDLRTSERISVLSKVIPKAIHANFEELDKYEHIAAYNPELPLTLKYLSKRRLYKRLIKANLSFIQFIDKFLS